MTRHFADALNQSASHAIMSEQMLRAAEAALERRKNRRRQRERPVNQLCFIAYSPKPLLGSKLLNIGRNTIWLGRIRARFAVIFKLSLFESVAL